MRGLLKDMCFTLLLVVTLRVLSISNVRAWGAEPMQGEVFENSLKMKLIYIAPGEFDMGSPEAEKGHGEDEVIHHVRITKGFYLGQHEVTVGQFQEYSRTSGNKTDAETTGEGGKGWDEATQQFWTKPEYTWQNPGFPQGKDHPVVNVSGNDAVAFCKWLSKIERKTYRLPTEAEWEYACRAGTKTAYFSGDDPELLVRFENMADAAVKRKRPKYSWSIKGDDGYVFTAPVGKFRANRWGVFDMHGNVREWCFDWVGPRDERLPDRIDPQEPFSEKLLVARGGAWGHLLRCSRSASRQWWAEDHRDLALGFRVVLEK